MRPICLHLFFQHFKLTSAKSAALTICTDFLVHLSAFWSQGISVLWGFGYSQMLSSYSQDYFFYMAQGYSTSVRLQVMLIAVFQRVSDHVQISRFWNEIVFIWYRIVQTLANICKVCFQSYFYCDPAWFQYVWTEHTQIVVHRKTQNRFCCLNQGLFYVIYPYMDIIRFPFVQTLSFSIKVFYAPVSSHNAIMKQLLWGNCL